MSKLYIGVMSGTSLDGVDVVLCEIDESSCRLLLSYEYGFDQVLKKEILHVISHESSLAQTGRLNHRLGLLFANSVNSLLKHHNIDRNSIRAIGLHGQTLWHESSGNYPFSMQLGDANVVSVETGIDVVCDFRSKDVAFGGQGAPFAPAFHEFLFQDLKNTCILNIGGMANITVLGETLLGYDSGPGNVLMDAWIAEHKNLPYDADGAWAQSGVFNVELLKQFLDEPFFMQSAPKSTGREIFNLQWLHKRLYSSNLSSKDVQATLLELTVRTIADEVKKFDVTQLLVCGGGVKNHFLMQRLNEELLDVKVTSTDIYGVSSEFMEAMAFAWLAHKRLNRESVNLKEVTGASQNAILGGVYAAH
ncbi:MAG: anhydro-N-acetylmuramic acid kinase [Campylobacterota bacterium]|nr:anhydro-N-acetylmuramic acid kinase [Campylobacterota bacterium]